MADRPLNFKGNVVNNLIYKGNTVVHVIETGPHCSNANRTVFYKWVTAPTLSADSGTTSKIITFSNTQKEPVAITYSCTGVLSSSGNITSLSAGSSSTITLNYTGSQGNETISAVFKLVADTSVIYNTNLVTVLGSANTTATDAEMQYYIQTMPAPVLAKSGDDLTISFTPFPEKYLKWIDQASNGKSIHLQILKHRPNGRNKRGMLEPKNDAYIMIPASKYTGTGTFLVDPIRFSRIHTNINTVLHFNRPISISSTSPIITRSIASSGQLTIVNGAAFLNQMMWRVGRWANKKRIAISIEYWSGGNGELRSLPVYYNVSNIIDL
jgi:hypothetical protein